MALKDIWKDLQNAIEGVPNSGDDISADDINNIAHAVIDLENDGVGDDLADVATSGKYTDLLDEPIIILSRYPTEEVLNSLGMGMFYWKSDYFTDSVLIISSDNEDWLVTDDNVNYKQQRWTQIIISESGIRKRQKINNRAYDDNRQETIIDWRYVPLDESLATKEYVDSAIGDIETSLENIIAKYGLGGDGV